jgi:hypothetical protein
VARRSEGEKNGYNLEFEWPSSSFVGRRRDHEITSGGGYDLHACTKTCTNHSKTGLT